jgi:hypothetical protein
MASTPSGSGYWLVASDGGVFSFGSAPFVGSSGGTGAVGFVAPAITSSGAGYWLANAAGRVDNYGDAPALGAAPPPSKPIVGSASTR